MLTDEEIHETIKTHNESLDTIVDGLIEAANTKGGIDNIAVVIAKKQEVNQAC